MKNAMGQREKETDIVLWSSSQVQVMGQLLMDYIAPPEVARLIREKVVMTPQTTDCSVPAGIFRNEGSMLNFIAYGDELNIVQPLRPSDVRQTWEQVWAMKLRLKSTAMAMLADGGARGAARERNRGADAGPRDAQQGQQGIPGFPGLQGLPGQPSQPSQPAAPSQPPSPADPVKEGVRALRGLFGF